METALRGSRPRHAIHRVYALRRFAENHRAHATGRRLPSSGRRSDLSRSGRAGHRLSANETRDVSFALAIEVRAKQMVDRSLPYGIGQYQGTTNDEWNYRRRLRTAHPCVEEKASRRV